MTIDERIERLTERHEALVQTFELWSIERKEQDQKWDQRFAQLLTIVEKTNEAVDKLSHIVELHQHRLNSHEDRLDTLEGTA